VVANKDAHPREAILQLKNRFPGRCTPNPRGVKRAPIIHQISIEKR